MTQLGSAQTTKPTFLPFGGAAFRAAVCLMAVGMATNFAALALAAATGSFAATAGALDPGATLELTGALELAGALEAGPEALPADVEFDVLEPLLLQAATASATPATAAMSPVL